MTPARAPHGWRLSAEARWMLPGCIALSVAAHALLLIGMAPPGPRPGGLPHAASRVARPASVRIVSEPQASGIAASAIAPAPQASGVPQVPAGGSSAASAPAQASSAGVRLSPAVLASTTLSAGEPAAPADAVDGGYIPRPFLSIAPNALAPVDIPTSPETAVPGRHVGVLALYIDELGRVRRIEAEQPALPEAMERAAREAFMAARFSPGQVDGHVVRSRIRVEVVFDGESAPIRIPAAASAAASTASATSAASVPRPAPGASAAKAAGAQRSP